MSCLVVIMLVVIGLSATIEADDERSDVLHPCGVGLFVDLSPYPMPYDNYECVDEEFPNGDTDYVYTTSSYWKHDLYELPDILGNQTVSFIVVNCNVRRTVLGNGNINGTVNLAKMSIFVNMGNVSYMYNSTEYILTTSWTNHQWYLYVNPYTNETWTADEVNNLEAGVALIGTQYQSRCTWVCVDVCY